MANIWEQFQAVPTSSGIAAGAPPDSRLAIPPATDISGLGTLQGPQYLDALTKKDPAGAAVVKQIGEGRAAYPTGFIMKTPYGQWLVSALGQAYPGMTAQDFQTKLATRKDFAVGKAGMQVKAANQAILHAGTALDASEKLGGSNMLPSIINPVRNLFYGETSPDFQANKATYDAAINALSGELTKTFRGSSGALADIEHWRNNAAAVDSPAARKASIQAGMTLLSGALESLTDQYNRGMKANNEPMDLLAPRNRAAFQKIMGSPPEGTVTAGFQGDTGVRRSGPQADVGAATSGNMKPGHYVYDPATKQFSPQ